MAQAICPSCKQTIRKPRAAKSINKHYQEDIAKANAAITTLENTIARNWNVVLGAIERLDFIEACELELNRMQRALNDPELLWSIYRRKMAKNGPAYGIENTQPVKHANVNDYAEVAA